MTDINCPKDFVIDISVEAGDWPEEQELLRSAHHTRNRALRFATADLKVQEGTRSLAAVHRQ